MMLINLEDIDFEKFCDSYCPEQGTKKIYEKYGRLCPNCLAESYHYWLLEKKGEQQETKLNEAIELLKEFAFYCVDETLEEHAKRAAKVREFLKTTPAKDWLEEQLRLIKCAYCETFDECEKQDGTCNT